MGRQPLFNGAYTRVSVFHTGSENPSCAEFERAYVKCMDQYGLKMGRKECWKEVEDTAECLYGYKQKARVNAMRLERLKQGRDHIEAPCHCYNTSYAVIIHNRKIHCGNKKIVT